MNEIAKCEYCNSDAKGIYYKFFYGRLLRETFKGLGVTTGIERKREYVIIGEGEAFICDQCVNKQRRKIILIFLPFLFTGGLAGFLWIKEHMGLAILFGLIAFGCLIFFRQEVNRYEFFGAGNQLAVKSKRQQYMAKGYNALLTPKERASLRRQCD